ncbi:hypothetical protein C0Z16_34145 [Paraburkholderia rhynchosiae]|uniref:Uncharacterized protein n=1 Tax=Paraburkholderia rhynchosiae TaxID=487049 RepID=A0ABX4UYS6_9BURK|nr:hypothetical protein C0Z16_34145 [Paraburkholderia rhynchosiae]
MQPLQAITRCIAARNFRSRPTSAAFDSRYADRLLMNRNGPSLAVVARRVVGDSAGKKGRTAKG